MKKTMFVSQMTEKQQELIEKKLKDLGLSAEDIQNAMDSRLCDLDETIDIHSVMNNDYLVQFPSRDGRFLNAEYIINSKNAEMAVNKAEALFEKEHPHLVGKCGTPRFRYVN